jgi:hypothetical protein
MGGVAYKFTSPGRKGVPDRIVCLPGGIVVFVELKTLTGVVSPWQEREIKRLADLGMTVVVMRREEDFQWLRLL